jgi:hypothetical protein
MLEKTPTFIEIPTADGLLSVPIQAISFISVCTTCDTNAPNKHFLRLKCGTELPITYNDYVTIRLQLSTRLG